MLNEPRVAPAEGERRAIGGYYPQYRVSASLILRALRERSLQWIRVADPEAGRVDDLQIGSQSRVDAFQIKWSLYGKPFRFEELTKPSGSTPGLIAHLADGWRRLQALHPGHRIVVHLITNKVPATVDRVTDGMPPPAPHHTAAFFEQAWTAAHKTPPNSTWTIPAPWQGAWQTLQAATVLSSDDFAAFARNCELEFGYRLPEAGITATRDQEILQQDLDHLTQTLFAVVAAPARIIELTRDQLLSRLGWKTRFEFRSHHEFPVPDLLYEPIEATAQQLQDALNGISSGYVAVLGSPGSGKSTLLTHTLRSRPERVIRYYAYVPDAPDPLQPRGESANFLHDVVLALERVGIQTGDSLSRFDHDQLLDRFYKQIDLLHRDWQATDRKTIILIDGLDHVAREVRPRHSFLRDLPLPEQIPPGVIILLGSQTDQLSDLPDRVQHAIRQHDRRIEILPLSRQAVFRILDRVVPGAILTQVRRERIYDLSGGHPLALVYLLNRIRSTTDENVISGILDQTERYEGNIEAQYHSYWRAIEQDEELVHLLGLVARIRGVIDLSWIETWADRKAFGRLRRTLSHYLRIESENRWYFFHPSFRLFLIGRTGESLPGVVDASRDRAFHRELADRCQASTGVVYWKWEELYHRVMAEQHETVLQRATPDYFREQFHTLRPAQAIDADIRLALRSAAAKEDPLALTRLALASAELGQRVYHLDNLPLVSLLLAFGEYDTAIKHLRDGNKLRVKPAAALRICVDLMHAGLRAEAQRIFELAEPLDLLSASAPIEHDPQDEKGALLEAWSAAASYFRNVEKIVPIARSICHVGDAFEQQGAETATRHLQNRILFHLGLALLEEQRWEDLATVNQAFDPSNPRDLEWWFWLVTHTWKHCAAAGDIERARHFVQELIDRTRSLTLNPVERVAIAEGIYRILNDQGEASQLLRDDPQPELRTDLSYRNPGLEPFLHRFRLNRLLYALGDRRSPREIIPDPRETRKEGLVYFERAVCVVACIWAEAWRGHILDSGTIEREVFPLLRLFNRQAQETRDWTSWYFLQRIRGDFYTLLVDAVAQHGPGATAVLADAFDQQWNASDTKVYWPTDVRRQIIFALFRAGTDRDWVKQRLELLESQMSEGRDVGGRIEEYGRQAEAWLTLNEKQSARRLLDQALRLSLGVGYRKDYQLNDWIYWLGRVNEIEPELAGERITWFARAILTLEQTTEGDASRVAANELLKIAFRWSPRRAISLFHFFLDQRIIWYGEAARVLLREALEDPSPPTALVLSSLADFLLPLLAEGDRELAAVLIKQTAAHHGNDKALDAVRYFLPQVAIFALPSTRRRWRRGAVQALQHLGLALESAGLTEADLQPDRDESSSMTLLKLKDGSTLTPDEVLMRADSVSSLRVFLENEADDSYFNWEPLVARIAGCLDHTDVLTLVALLKGKHRSAHILAALSERLATLGYTDAAWELGLQALDASKEYGWSRWMDGGSRLAAFGALIRADKIRARPLLYQTLAQDGGGGAGNLEDIIPLLVDNLPVREIWEEVDKYVRQLFDGTPLPSAAPENSSNSPLQDTPARAIADLVARHVDHPANLVAQAAQRTCTKLLLQPDRSMQQSIQELLGKGESRQEHILAVFQAVAQKQPDAAAPFQSEILRLSQSRNYAIRSVARTLCARIGSELPPFSKPSFQLPAIYKLSLPPGRPDLLTTLQITSELPLPDSDDPREIISPFHPQFDAIAEATRLPKINVYHRAVQIMRQLDPPDFWSAAGEGRLRAVLDSAGLRLSFRRPRAVLARRALFHIIAELLDAGVLSPAALRHLEPILRFQDPQMLLVAPAARSEDIPRIPRKERYTESNEQWIERIDDSRVMVKSYTQDGRHILAEDTVLKVLEWGVPTETRRSIALTAPLSPPVSDSDLSFHDILPTLVSEYPNLRIKGSPLPLTIRNGAYIYDTPGASWIALNPTIGERLGWTLTDVGLFRWVNDAGQTMVEMIWWVDGPIQQSPPHFDDEVGEGWLVIASQDAFSAIKSEFPQLRREVQIKRHLSKDIDRLTRTIRWTETVDGGNIR